MEIIYRNLGLAEDPRTEEQKALDYKADPAGAVVVNWVEKTPDQWKKYTSREQDGSLSCMAQMGAKAMETVRREIFSAHPPYRSRSNFPDGGMYTQDLGNVLKKIGTNFESIDPSQHQNETTMNRPIEVGTPDKIEGYFQPLNPKNIDQIAAAIELYKHCGLVVHCNKDEWTSMPQFKNLPVDFGHGICAIDYFLFNGLKYILLEDSTGHFNSFDGNGQRLLSADFIEKRVDDAISFIVSSTFKFLLNLKVGSTGLEVRKLQQILKVKVDGKFGPKTRNALVVFQQEHNLFPDGIVGPKTRAVLNN